MEKRDQDLLALAIGVDILDALPPLPGINTVQSVIDAAMIQAVRTRFPDDPSTTLLQTPEIIEAPIPFIPAPHEVLLPSHAISVIKGLQSEGIEVKSPLPPLPALPKPPKPPKLPPPPKLPYPLKW